MADPSPRLNVTIQVEDAKGRREVWQGALRSGDVQRLTRTASDLLMGEYLTLAYRVLGVEDVSDWYRFTRDLRNSLPRKASLREVADAAKDVTKVLFEQVARLRESR